MKIRSDTRTNTGNDLFIGIPEEPFIPFFTSRCILVGFLILILVNFNRLTHDGNYLFYVLKDNDLFCLRSFVTQDLSDPRFNVIQNIFRTFFPAEMLFQGFQILVQ